MERSVDTNGNIIAKVYRGETVIGDFVLLDDTGKKITQVDDVIVLFTDLSYQGAKQLPLVLRIGDGIDFDEGVLQFTLSPEQTDGLPNKVGFEVKVVISGIVRIAMRNIFTMVDNIVKSY